MVDIRSFLRAGKRKKVCAWVESRREKSWNLLLRRDNELIRRLQEEAREGYSFAQSESEDFSLTEVICIN